MAFNIGNPVSFANWKPFEIVSIQVTLVTPWKLFTKNQLLHVKKCDELLNIQMLVKWWGKMKDAY